jgi:hypothetical protein
VPCRTLIPLDLQRYCTDSVQTSIYGSNRSIHGFPLDKHRRVPAKNHIR